MAPQRCDGGGLASRLGPEAPQSWAGATSKKSSLLESIHGAIVSVLLSVGVGLGTLPIVAGLLNLLLHLGRVGWWRAVRRQVD